MAFAPDKKSGSRDYGDSASESFFGKTMRIEGKITSDEDLTIEGKVKGQLKVSKTLTIGKEGYVNGKISAAVVRISGEAEGHLAASDKLEITSEGKYTGNIKSDTINVAEGAQLKGTINLEEEKASKSKTRAKKTEPEPEEETTSMETTEPDEHQEEQEQQD